MHIQKRNFIPGTVRALMEIGLLSVEKQEEGKALRDRERKVKSVGLRVGTQCWQDDKQRQRAG